MDLTSEILFHLIKKKYILKLRKKRKLEREKDLSLPLFKKRNNKKETDEKDDINNDELLSYFFTLILNDSNIYSISYISIDPFINSCFQNIQYLSLANNFVRKIDFILKMPDLFYLDLYGNPLEDVTVLNYKNTFGYLRLSIERFNEKKVLNVMGLCCGIFELDLKEKSIIKLFKNNNNEICIFNNEVNYFIDKIKFEENKKKIATRKNQKIERKCSNISIVSNSSNVTNNSGVLYMKKLKAKEKTFQEKVSEEIIHEKIIYHNELLLELKNFFERFKGIFKNNANTIQSKVLQNNELYLSLEKTKMILIFKLYQKISNMNEEILSNKFYIGNTNAIYSNLNMDNIHIYNIKNKMINLAKDVRVALILLISILFYSLGIISGKMMYALIRYIFIKYYKFDENKKFPDLPNMGNIHYLSFYYSIYKYITSRFENEVDKSKINKYKDIFELLKMDKLILKSNLLHQKMKTTDETIKNLTSNNANKNKIKLDINFIKELEITKEFLILIEFLCDFIIYDKIEYLLINKSYPDEYSYLIELKETIEEKVLQKNIPFNKTVTSLSINKYQKNQIERIFNKYYFKQKKMEEIKNKDFNQFESTDKKYYFTSTPKYLNILQEVAKDEYVKTDDIDVDSFFTIDKLNDSCMKSLSKTKFMRSNLDKYKFETDCFGIEDDDELMDYNYKEKNNQLPMIKKNNNKDLRYFKRILINSDFLSQHARNILKFEKIKKKYARSKSNKKGSKDCPKKSLKFVNIANSNESNSANQSDENTDNENDDKNNNNPENKNEKNICNKPMKSIYNHTSENYYKTLSINNLDEKKNVAFGSTVTNLSNKKFDYNDFFKNRVKMSLNKNHSNFYNNSNSIPGITVVKFNLPFSVTQKKISKAQNNTETSKKENKSINKNIQRKIVLSDIKTMENSNKRIENNREKIISRIREISKNNVARNVARIFSRKKYKLYK